MLLPLSQKFFFEQLNLLQILIFLLGQFFLFLNGDRQVVLKFTQLLVCARFLLIKLLLTCSKLLILLLQSTQSRLHLSKSVSAALQLCLLHLRLGLI